MRYPFLICYHIPYFYEYEIFVLFDFVSFHLKSVFMVMVCGQRNDKGFYQIKKNDSKKAAQLLM